MCPPPVPEGAGPCAASVTPGPDSATSEALGEDGQRVAVGGVDRSARPVAVGVERPDDRPAHLDRRGDKGGRVGGAGHASHAVRGLDRVPTHDRAPPAEQLGLRVPVIHGPRVAAPEAEELLRPLGIPEVHALGDYPRGPGAEHDAALDPAATHDLRRHPLDHAAGRLDVAQAAQRRTDPVEGGQEAVGPAALDLAPERVQLRQQLVIGAGRADGRDQPVEQHERALEVCAPLQPVEPLELSVVQDGPLQHRCARLRARGHP